MSSVGGTGSSGGSDSASRAADAAAKADEAAKAAERAQAAAAAKKAEEVAKNPVVDFLSDMFSVVTGPVGAVSDFARNYEDMKAANVINADGYFHCKANYEAASRGYMGSNTAMNLNTLREVSDAIRGKSSFEAYSKDMAANWQGLMAANSGRYSSAQEACAELRPNGLPDKY